MQHPIAAAAVVAAVDIHTAAADHTPEVVAHTQVAAAVGTPFVAVAVVGSKDIVVAVGCKELEVVACPQEGEAYRLAEVEAACLLEGVVALLVAEAVRQEEAGAGHSLQVAEADQQEVQALWFLWQWKRLWSPLLWKILW